MNNKKLSIRVLFPLIMSISIVFCILSCMILFSHYISTYLVRKTIEETSRQKNVLAQNIENEIDSINSIMNNIYYNTIKKYDIQDKNFKTILANEITSNSETIYGLALYDTDGKNLWHSNNLTSTSIDKVNLDRNKNNKLDYILIEGEQTHFDAVRRTNGFLESSQNLPLNQLTNLSADWQRNLSSVKFSKLDTSIIQSAEAIICNNDDMALGVYDYYKQHNLKLPLILGINNSPEMNQKIQAGEIYGTVDNGTNDQISYICKLLNDILNKDTAKYHKIWYSKPFAIEK